MTQSYDVVVVGSGYAGSLMAMIAKRQGRSVALLEKGRHPRVVIGESSTPLSNLLLETLADKYDLPMLKPLTKWGTWQGTYPQIACGLKRGFTFFYHDFHGLERCGEERQLLVAASPNDAIADTHWFRADSDAFLVRQAIALGVDYINGCDIQQMEQDPGGWILTTAEREFRAKFVIDGTGPRGFLHRALRLEELELPEYPQTAALYSHFSGVEEVGGAAVGEVPYPPDAAALHHVFDGGWMWVLRFNNGWTSAGFAVTKDVAERFGFAEGQAAWERMLDALPAIKAQFAFAKAERPFTYVPRLAYRSARIAGENWAMLPSAAGFVDPLLSTGFPLTLLGMLRLGDILERGWEREWGTQGMEQSLAHYASQTDGELLATARLIAALYANMDDFETFGSLSLLYFAAASYAETVRRLGKPERARSFLLHEDAVFGPGSRRILERARRRMCAAEKAELREEIYRLIEPFDVAGLGQRPQDHCYPVRAEDLFAAAGKAGATRRDMEELLWRSGFLPQAGPQNE